MINPSEHRPGNYIQDATNPDIAYQIKFMHEEGLDIGYRKLLNYDQFSPIPLTLEILKKCGFRNDHGEGSRIWKLNDVEIFHYEIDKSFSFYFKGKEKILEHLHQIQNLYFALTGNEIEYAAE